MTRVALLALLGACFTSTDPAAVEHDLRCTFFTSCNADGIGSTVEIMGTVDQLTEEADDWVAACSQIALMRVEDGECKYVWCGADCHEVPR